MKLGIDATSISRFEGVSSSFASRFCHIDEINQLQNQPNSAEYLAGIWAIKEAMFKADNSMSNFSNICLKRTQNHWKYDGWLISITHEKDMLIAVVIKEE
ncbi:holo-ACP synthase [Mycoplasma simbae]|uniref:holo-ACP synthase n=1 Tax=Mycoplasma simbae TaxID=36744 RepID=UPI000494F35B|nr:4'-phosphopantetheinyl transferase superfamily protein [Mycoplasma simbae]